jgi:hypothetical protein
VPLPRVRATVTGISAGAALTTRSGGRSSSYHAPAPAKATTMVEITRTRRRAIFVPRSALPVTILTCDFIVFAPGLNVTEPPQRSKFNLDERIVVLRGEVVADHPRLLRARPASPGIICAADRWLEVPAWMFDRAACPDPPRLTASPFVSVDALSALSDLLGQALKSPLSSSNVPHSGASRSSHDQNRGEAHDGAKLAACNRRPRSLSDRRTDADTLHR